MKKLTIRATDEEYIILQSLADKAGMSLNAYMLTMSKDTLIYSPNYESIDQHTKEISELRSDINSIMRTIVKTDEAYNADIKNILDILN